MQMGTLSIYSIPCILFLMTQNALTKLFTRVWSTQAFWRVLDYFLRVYISKYSVFIPVLSEFSYSVSVTWLCSRQHPVLFIYFCTVCLLKLRVLVLVLVLACNACDRNASFSDLNHNLMLFQFSCWLFLLKILISAGAVIRSEPLLCSSWC